MEIMILILLTALGLLYLLFHRLKAAEKEMARLRQQMALLQNRMAGYVKFVPNQVFEILKRQDITEVLVGDQRELETGVLMIDSRRFKELAKIMEGEELYGMINRMYQGMIPVVLRYDGFVEQMVESGLRACFVSGSEGALKAAVSVCELINRWRSEGEIFPVFRMAVAYGMVKIGIIGQEERASASVISEIMTALEFLVDMGDKYGARILVTGIAASQIPDFEESFHTRLLGYVYIKLNNTVEAVYDVYDGDEQEERRLKKDTRELFQEAVTDFMKKSFYDAREKFAKVLRQNRFDKAAKEYIYRCDSYYQAGETADRDLYLEHF